MGLCANGRPRVPQWCLALALLAQWLATASSQGLRGGYLYPVRKGRTVHFDLNVTLSMGSPCCGVKRPVILINGMFQPTLVAKVNDTVEITLRNQLPTSLPQTSSGISIHFHGMGMWDSAVWADGTSYVTQCPLAAGQTWTYSFLANESPGTYFYHDHSAMNRANGLQGAVVLEPADVKPPLDGPYTEDGEFVVFISDWFNTEANLMGMQLNRPWDPAHVTNDTGTFMGPGQPAALLINGKGNQNDCNPGACKVTDFAVPASTSGPGCTHEQFTVVAGKHYRFRIINAGTQQYVTVCFHGHQVNLIAADTTPMDSITFSNGCVDLHTGQRYDANITANQKPGLYWISVHTQFEQAAPSAFAVLRYANAPNNQRLPSTPTPQTSSIAPWTLDDLYTVVTSDFILGYNDNYDYQRYWNQFLHGGSYDLGVLYYDAKPDKVVVLNMTMPVMSNGMIRWAMNNVATSPDPPCQPVMELIQQDPQFLSKHLAPADAKKQEAASHMMLQAETFDDKSQLLVYGGSRIPVLPIAGMQVIELKKGMMVDVIINNMPVGSHNGDHYSSTGAKRTFSVRHPIHMHGQRFWVMGEGMGVYDPVANQYDLNFNNPILRDTATVAENGWLYLRFRAANVGLWPLHCHIMWHAYMGQQMFFAVGMDKVPKRPTPGPKCPKNCLSSFAPFTRSWVKKQYNGTRYQLPKRLRA